MEETPHMHSNHTDQQVTIGVQDSLVSHRSIACIHVNGNASLDLDTIGQQTQATYGSAHLCDPSACTAQIDKFQTMHII